jgi:hypothetical protein
MKKFYFLTLLLVAGISVSAQNVAVTFAVDMKNETVSANGVHIAGSFQMADGNATDWDPAGTELTDADADGIYTYTANIPAGTYAYKFVNGNAWGSDEGVPGGCAVGGNREVVVSGAMTVPTVCYALCIACPSAIDTSYVKFTVDMSGQTVSGAGVHMAGGFGPAGLPNWDPAGIALADNGDGTWSTTLNLPQGEWAFKFVNGNAWGSDESIPSECVTNGNRAVVVTGDNDEFSEQLTDILTFITMYGGCPPKDSADVTFNVDMNNQTVSTNGVHIAGGFGNAGYPDWDPEGIALTDADADGIYSTTLRLPVGAYGFKFINGNAWGSDESIPTACKVGDNRGITVSDNGNAASDVSVQSFDVCFGKCTSTCPAPLPPVKVTFRVDMTNEIVAATGVYVAGSFSLPAWDKDTFKLEDADGNEVYEFSIDVIPGEYEYKFFNGSCGDDGCQETSDFNGGGCGSGGGFNNRSLNLEGVTNDTIIGTYVYNSCEISTASIKKLNTSELNIYPNPAKGYTTVSFVNNSNETYTATLVDLAGRTLTSASTNSTKINLTWNTITPGIYFVTLSNENGASTTKKLFID